ncbi:MAG: RAMP superfamily protein [uncultured Sulfurovum sp.]|uniref:RAMP superfamily protein n=1 Tax=uncultured Sulfurovum sp. TaxID=269237 RepID=A0A6S6TFU3_9BACT|nr:MAG: RAMP superfamily protein [uncultured Sulfurovum sp.]
MKIAIKFFTYWHCGSGSSGGSSVDALVARDAKGLPYIPGKTLKGHIREMAETLNDNEFVDTSFGVSKDGIEKEGACYFSNAVIEEDIDEKLISYLFKTISATQINEEGLAVDGSLREIEVVVPITLFASIENCKDEKQMKKAFSQVKRMGLNRTRGLGRCEITLVGECDD